MFDQIFNTHWWFFIVNDIENCTYYFRPTSDKIKKLAERVA